MCRILGLFLIIDSKLSLVASLLKKDIDLPELYKASLIVLFSFMKFRAGSWLYFCFAF